MRQLRISAELALPLDATTQAIGILAKRRVGKSYTARRFVEQLYKAGQQVVIVDPKGDWWGIRSAADGKTPGLPVVILGGERGDAPLEVGAGEIVAKLVTDERVSVLLDLSLFRKHEVATFMTSFLENLYRLKAREALRTPLMLILDEADAIAPQKPQENETRMLGAAEDIVRRGGQRGLGCTLITQRSAVLNKNVLTQVEMLVAMRTIAPQDLKALDEWINVHGTREQRATLMESLPSLPKGDAWFWSPGWPTEAGIFQRTHVSKIETFDSGATPQSGEKRVEPKNLADVDLAALTKQMAATIERAKADDPKELRREISRLKGELAKAGKQAAPPDPAALQARIDGAVEAAITGERKRARHANTRLRSQLADVLQGLGTRIPTALVNVDNAVGVVKASLASALDAIEDQLIGTPTPVVPTPVRHAPRLAAPIPLRATGAPARPAAAASTNGDLSPGEQRVLNALAELEGMRVHTPTRAQAGAMARYDLSGGSGSTYVGRLVAAGFISLPGKGTLELTVLGRTAAAQPEPLLGDEELQTRAMDYLKPGEARILKRLIELYPDSTTRASLGPEVAYDLTGGSGSTYVGKLVRLGFVDLPGSGQLRASDLLFPSRS